MIKKIHLFKFFLVHFWVIPAFFAVSNTYSQPSDIHVYGVIHNEGEPLNKSLVTVYYAGEEFFSQRTKADGEFDFHLDYGKNYVLEFSKLRHYSKIINLFAKDVLQYKVSPGMKFGGWQVELYEEVSGVDASVLDEAVGEFYFDEYSRYFDWNAELAIEMQEKLEELQAEIEEQKRINLENRKESFSAGFNRVIVEAPIAVPGKDIEEERVPYYEKKLKEAYLKIPKEVTEEVIEYPTFTVTKRNLIYPGKPKSIVFRKVVHDWGGKYYFRNGVSITGYIFELETSTPENYLPSVD